MENPSFIFSSGPIELKEEGENFYAEGYLSTSELDLVNDIVTKDCIMDMANQMRSRTIKMDVEHESFRGNSELDRELNKTIIPIGKIDDFLIDKKGLKIKTILNKHSQRFEEVKNSIQDGFLDAFSIAFVPIESKTEMRDGKEVRLLHKINLLNSAYTGNPVNTGSNMTKVFAKSLEFLEDQKAKPKKPKPQPDPHKEPDEEDDEEGEEGKKKKKKKEEVKENPLSYIWNKIMSGGILDKKEIKLLKAAMDVADNKGTEAQLARELFDKVSSGLKLSWKEYYIFKELVAIEYFEGEMVEKVKSKNNHNHENDTIKSQEVKNMTEDKDKDVDKKPEGEEKPEAKPEEKPEEPEKPEEKDNPGEGEGEGEDKPEEPAEPAEPAEPEKPEGKPEEKDIDKLKEDMVEVKAALKRPMLKSKVEQVNKAGIQEEKSLNPLDVIA